MNTLVFSRGPYEWLITGNAIILFFTRLTDCFLANNDKKVSQLRDQRKIQAYK